VSLVVKLVREEYAARWGLHLQPQWVIELDSSTPDKFSRHLIIRAPGYAFPNNGAVGAFVAAVLSKPQAVENLWVVKPPKAGEGPPPPDGGNANWGPAAAAALPAGAAAAARGAPAANGQACAGGGAEADPVVGAIPASIAAAAAAATAGLVGRPPCPPGLEMACVVDQGVYTKNRHFRLIWNCKGGKTVLLEPTTRFAMSAQLQ
jgi:hypothetical protein